MDLNFQEYQRLHSISEHQKDLNQRSPPPTYPRCGSEFFARASARGLPTSASDTRLSGKINHQQVNQLPSIPKNKNQNVLDTRTNQNIGSPPTTDRSTNKATLNYTQIPAVCGSRTLSSHILWRSACRRDNVSHLPTAPQQVANSSKQQPFNRTNQQFTGFPDGNNSFDADEFLDVRDETHTRDFRYPFSDLLIWAVLTKRHDMAICMWQHGQEALAKALVTCRLYKSLAKEAAEDYLELEVCEELKKCAEEFRQLSLDLLDHCYKEDDAQTLQLLTYELAYWGRETCLSLAVLVNNKQFLAHPCCQILLADLWHGGLRIRSENEDVDSDYDLSEKTGGASLSDRRRRVSSRGSMQSLNFTSIFQSKRRSKRSSHINASNSLNTQDLELGRVPNQECRNLLDEPSIGRSRSNARELRRPKTKTRAERQRRINASNAATVGGQTIIETGGGDTSPSDYSLSNQISKPSLPLKSSLKLPATVTPLHIDVNAYHHPQFLLGNDDIVTSGKEEEKDSNSIQRNSTSTISDEVVKLSVDKEQDIPSPDQNPSDRPFIHQTKSFPFNNRWKFVKNIGAGIATNDKPKTMEHPNSRLTISGGHVPKGIPLPEGVTLNKKRQIKFRRKVYEFFVAPITTFWAWMLSFVVFLSTLTYVLLIRTPLKPTFLEWYLLAYVVGFGIETVRKFAMSEPKKFSEKVQYFFGNYWNFLTTVAILGFVVGFIFRLNPSTSRSVGRIILAVDSVLWTIKLLDFLGVFPRFGPYITMAGKMIMNMSSIVVMLGISLLGFGLARQSITYPNEDWHWLLLRNVFYKPYFMLYGEVYADEIDTCGDEAWDEHLDKNISISTAWTHRDNRDKELACVPGHWIPPIL
uniref:Ion transport domain-containing protein n=1 Tax=Meloidogyne javanica TaxID=6303 RepID=A0A915N0C1_MELJA